MYIINLVKHYLIGINRSLIITNLVFLLMAIASCKKFINVAPPVTSANASTVYNDISKAASVLTGIYTNMSKGTISGVGFTSVTLYSGLSADELELFDLNNNSMLNYYRNQLTNSNSSAIDFWSIIYRYVYVVNDAIEGITASSLPEPVKLQLLGEAKFIRAFCYFYLVNLYGDVPLVLTTDYKVNALVSRTPKSEIWSHILDDLNEAQVLLTDKYVKADAVTPYDNGSEERVRPNKWAAKALLARAYLYTGDYANAEAQSSEIIKHTTLYDTVSLSNINSNVFAKNSKEAIWQLQSIGTTINSNTPEGRLFILPKTGPNALFPVYLGANIVNAFELGDQRKVFWVGSVTPSSSTTTYFYPAKYKIGNSNTSNQEYSMVLRLGEQYLIRAEARAQQDNFVGAAADLDVIRKRARLNNTSAKDKTSFLSAIMQERKVELFTEWGHRWLDLKRSNTIGAVMEPICAQKGGLWNSDWALYPIILTELEKNPNLIQNTGY